MGVDPNGSMFLPSFMRVRWLVMIP